MPHTDLDKAIIKLLQNKGLIRKEAEAYLKAHVYKLQQAEIEKIKNYATHFGIQAKEKLIEEILEIRRENVLSRLARDNVQIQPSTSSIHKTIALANQQDQMPQ